MINRDEWLRAVQEAEDAPVDDSDAVTLAEFAALIGLQRAQAGRRMKDLVRAGKATPTVKRIRRTQCGVVTVPAYRLVK